MLEHGFVMHQRGVTTGVCPYCNTALTASDVVELNAAMVRHWNFTHDIPTDEEDR